MCKINQMNRLNPFAISLITILSLLLNVQGQAQSPSVDSLLSKALASDVLLPMLMDSAIKYSAEARMSRSNENLALANFEIKKKAVYNALSLHTSYGYGTNYSAVNNQSSTVANNLTTGQSMYYNVGVGLQLPITQIINRKSIRKAEQSIVEIAVADKDKTVLQIRQEVIKLYQDFKLVQKLMAVSYKNLQSAIINNTLAEKNFLNGQISVEQASIVQGNYNNAVIAYETYKNSFQSSYLQLEMYTGTSLSSLIMSIK
jgi:outer membrane protein TolC